MKGLYEQSVEADAQQSIAAGSKSKVGAGLGIFGNGAEIIGDEVVRRSGRFSFFQFVGARSKIDCQDASFALVLMEFSREVCDDFLPLFVRKEKGDPLADFFRAPHEFIFLIETLFQRIFLAFDLRERLRNLLALFGIDLTH